MARIAVRGLGLTSLALAGATGPAAAVPTHAQLRSFVCQTSVQPASRAISVTSVMRPVGGTRSMSVRFELLSRAGGASGYTAVSGRDLGRWLSPSNRSLGSRAGDVWILNKPVVGLPAPATYRFRVSFRWFNRRHHVITSTVRETGDCRQVELRPDLVIRRIAAPQAIGSKQTHDLYTVTVANQGNRAAGGFTVGLVTRGAATATASVRGLGAHRSTQVTLRGPLCSATAPPVLTADLYDQVDDFDRANNVATASCTAATTPF